VVVPAPALLIARAYPLPCRASPRLGHATFRVAVPAATVIAIAIAIAALTVTIAAAVLAVTIAAAVIIAIAVAAATATTIATTTTTKTLRGDGRSPQDREFTLPEVPKAQGRERCYAEGAGQWPLGLWDPSGLLGGVLVLDTYYIHVPLIHRSNMIYLLLQMRESGSKQARCQ
jgi:hypothetical protein